jgi:leucyl-tRNA synthetase
MDAAIARAEELGVGRACINYKMRDAVFSRQRYWGEPVPVYFNDGIPCLLEENELPLVLPEINEYKPTEQGDPPLGRAKDWLYHKDGASYPYELSTMPGWAGSSWYFLRYMDARNENEFASKEAIDYWQQVDLYVGGTEHAVGHLLYSRFWHKFLYDMGYVGFDEPYKRLLNQGKIQGRSSLIYKVKNENTFVSKGLASQYETVEMHVDITLVNSDVLDIEAYRRWRPEFAEATFLLEDGQYICGDVVEKMSKSKYNVVNPDEIVNRYGADTLRLYEMFLGPVEQDKPWSVQGIEGVSKFLKKLWRLFFDERSGTLAVSDEAPSAEELKVLHKTIKKVEDDVEAFSFNTTVSAFMVCVNELTALRCNKRAVLTELLVLLWPYAPHTADELWEHLGNAQSIGASRGQCVFPEWKEEFLKENAFEYPISINGKLRAKMTFALDTATADIEREVLAAEAVQRWVEGKTPKKVVIVPGKIVNIVV